MRILTSASSSSLAFEWKLRLLIGVPCMVYQAYCRSKKEMKYDVMDITLSPSSSLAPHASAASCPPPHLRSTAGVDLCPLPFPSFHHPNIPSSKQYVNNRIECAIISLPNFLHLRIDEVPASSYPQHCPVNKNQWENASQEVPAKIFVFIFIYVLVCDYYEAMVNKHYWRKTWMPNLVSRYPFGPLSES